MKAIAFTICDSNNEKYLPMLTNSLRKFHNKEELPLRVIYKEELADYLKKDPMFFYRATPVIGRELIEDYDMVLKLDVDQIITGKLDYLLKTDDYDVGTVLNFNEVDMRNYGLVSFQGILPQEYFNCGLVAMRSKDFIQEWKELCFSKYFDRLQYKEQDLLNVLCHYSPYVTRCFDTGDISRDYYAFHGLIAKSLWKLAVLKDKKVIIPKQPNGFPKVDIELKVIHWAGGNSPIKMNYHVFFSEEVATYIDSLVKE